MELRTIEGYVCIGKIGIAERLFGLPVDPDFLAQKYESLLSNGLKPYPTLDKAKEAKAMIAKRSDIENAWIGRIKMGIAESYKKNESPLFRKARSLVIITSREFGGNAIYGPAVAGRPKTCNEFCSELVVNGLKRFRSYKSIYWPLREVMRLTQLPTRLATFSLKRVAG